ASSNNANPIEGQEVASGLSPDRAKEPLITADGRPTPRGWRRVGELLAVPMPTRSFTGRGGQRFEYVTARQVAKRLDDVVGPGNWSDSYRVLSMEPWIVECTLTVCGVAKSDVVYSNTPEAEPGEEAEPAKAAFSDSCSRAA